MQPLFSYSYLLAGSQQTWQRSWRVNFWRWEKGDSCLCPCPDLSWARGLPLFCSIYPSRPSYSRTCPIFQLCFVWSSQLPKSCLGESHFKKNKNLPSRHENCALSGLWAPLSKTYSLLEKILAFYVYTWRCVSTQVPSTLVRARLKVAFSSSTCSHPSCLLCTYMKLFIPESAIYPSSII